MSEKKSESFQINGKDGPINFPAGKFYFNSQARLERLFDDGLSEGSRRVYAVLEKATMGFRQELAVRLDRGQKVPLTPSDIASRLSLSNQSVRQFLEELEYAGLAERRSDDGGALRQGHVLIYSWATPRAPKSKPTSSCAQLLPDWFPESWESIKPLLKRWRIRLPLDEVVARNYFDFEAIAEAARIHMEAEEVLARTFKSRGAHNSHNKEDRNDRKNYKERASAAAAGTVGSIEIEQEPEPSPPPPQPPPAPPKPAPDPDPPPPPWEPDPPPAPVQSLVPANGNANGHSNGRPEGFNQIHATLRFYDPSVSVTDTRKLIENCRKARAGIETAHIDAVIHMKAQKRGSARSMYAVLSRQVPEFVGDDDEFYLFLQHPEKWRAEPATAEERHKRSNEKLMEMARRYEESRKGARNAGPD